LKAVAIIAITGNLLPTLCRDAAKAFFCGLFCYQPFAAMRRSIILWILFAKNLVPLRGEALHIGILRLNPLHFP